MEEISDFDGEEKKSEDEKSEESFYYRNSDANLKLLESDYLSQKLYFHYRLSFSSDDCSRVIYSPPELL